MKSFWCFLAIAVFAGSARAQTPVDNVNPVNNVSPIDPIEALRCWDFDTANRFKPCENYQVVDDSCSGNLPSECNQAVVTYPNMELPTPFLKPPFVPGLKTKDYTIPCIKYQECKYSYVSLNCVVSNTWYVNGPSGKKGAGQCPEPDLEVAID